MATAMTSGVGQIGETAGMLWHVLQESGPVSVSRLVKSVDDVPRDVILQAIGWLAREDKIEIEETGRGRMISLREMF